MYIRRGPKQMKNVKQKGSKKIVAIIIIIAGLVLLYVGVAIYFTNHFFLFSKMNGEDVSGRSIKYVEKIYQNKVKNYVLTLQGKAGEEHITGNSIQLEYQDAVQIKKLLKKQQSFLWPMMFWKKNEEIIKINLSYDKTLLEETIHSLNMVNADQSLPKSATPIFDGAQYVIQKEEYGTALNLDVLKQEVEKSIKNLADTLNLEEIKCYDEPKYTSDDKEVMQACEQMNKYCKASVTYQMSEPVVVNKDLIHTWIGIDENMNVSLNKDAIRTWMGEFGDKYDTVGTTRNYTMVTGKSASVTGGTYGWSIDEDTEFSTLLELIESGQTVEKLPAYYVGGTAVSQAMPDWGNTYVDVDLSEQYLRYMIDNTIALETPIISGEPIPEKITPEGVYKIEEKKIDAILVGEVLPGTTEPSYRTQVTYWMRITWDTGVGLHDATWQPAFGGSLNQTPGVGSHGCINMPYGQAEALYGMIAEGTPVVVHY